MSDKSWHSIVEHLPTWTMADGGKGYVYVLLSDDGSFKIGETMNPLNRFRRLEKKYKFQWWLVMILESERCWNHEGQLHQHFRAKRCYGVQDWFWLDDEDLDYIKSFIGGDS